MRILSWNINGIRTLPQYHPWNTFKSFHQVLLHLQADIICFQEMKASRGSLDRNLAVPDPFHAFFSFPANKGGYSGVAVYTDTRTVTPLRAEEGLSGTVQPKVPLTTDERISRSYPSAHEMELMPDDNDNTPSDLTALDAEGRALVVDFGLFVLINVYCPNETSDVRLPFKMNYHFMLQERVNKLIGEGREVIVVGDINVCAAPLDHCDGHLTSNAATFHDHPARAWFHNWLTPNGSMTDMVRSFWSGRKGMYTCWNTKISARETNYGTRIDYILVTQGMLPWIKHGDIQPFLKGSDHCPIFIDLHDEITTPTGQMLSLRQVMLSDRGQTEPPRLAARCWDEFSGKQTLLSSFFAKGGKMTTAAPAASDATDDSQPPGSPSPCSSHASAILSTDTAPQLSEAVSPDLAHVQDPDFTTLSESLPFLTAATGPTPQSPTPTPLPSESNGDPETKRVAPLKRASTDPPAAVASKPSKKQKKDKGKQTGSDVGSGSGQRTLAAFFAPQASQSQSSPQLPPLAKSQRQPSASQTEWGTSEHPFQLSSEDDQIATDHRLALHLTSLREAEPSPLLSSTKSGSCSNSKEAWSLLMAPTQPPKCTIHGEPAKEYTVNKPGPNKGKTFFICSRPVGPGYDKGKGERPREEVVHRYRCNFFIWSANARREALKKNGDTPQPNRP
ncbi:Endonuclease/exonuclease/phosphatase [Boletus edulis BED1]|uniref:DNA-(apurinic or apyrimidinic site) endonuclease n=1 Tax=Boletus edulis BED1 TaxID=1328754 RepID=A0AAD4C5A7_BOLED|nr:Endonuclease/exonuclease/phosphatase [Boletus edulis BED1]